MPSNSVPASEVLQGPGPTEGLTWLGGGARSCPGKVLPPWLRPLQLASPPQGLAERLSERQEVRDNPEQPLPLIEYPLLTLHPVSPVLLVALTGSCYYPFFTQGK